MAKNKGGRPTKMDDLTVKKLEEAFINGATDVQACFYAGISKQTLYTYQDKNPEFIDRKEALKANLGLIAKNVLAKSIRDDDNANDAKWYLERKEKKEYSTQTNQQFLDGEGEPTDASLVLEIVTSNVKDTNT